jgi:DNA-binding beta-propeller fold protein YncE
MKTRRLAVALAAVVLGSPIPLPAADGPYRRLKEIAIGGEGGWDYLSVDTAARRLYVSHATKVVVVDIDKDAVVGEIAPAPGVHGIALAPDLGRAFVSNGRADTVSIVDMKSLQILGAVKTGANPDAILYDPARREVYAFNHTGHSVTVFDAKTGEVSATIALPGVAEFAVLEPKASRVYVNVEDTSQIVAIDTASHAAVATFSLAPGEEPTGLALDPEGRRLFAACGNQRLVMTDAADGRVLASVPIGAGADGAAFDPGTGFAFASNGDGTLTIARSEERDKLAVVQTLTTPKRSRTMTLDPKTHRLYVAAAEFAPPSAGPDGKPQRPQVVPGSFKIVVFELAGPPGR